MTGGVLVGLLVVFIFKPRCLFLRFIGIPCPGCGLTRAFREIFNGKFLSAFKYNILSIFIFIFLLFSLVLFIIDIIKKTNYLEKYLLVFKKYYLLVLIFVLISWIVNIIRY